MKPSKNGIVNVSFSESPNLHHIHINIEGNKCKQLFFDFGINLSFFTESEIGKKLSEFIR